MISRFRPWMDKAAKTVKRTKPVVQGYSAKAYGFGVYGGARAKALITPIAQRSKQIDTIATKRVEKAIKKDEWI